MIVATEFSDDVLNNFLIKNIGNIPEQYVGRFISKMINSNFFGSRIFSGVKYTYFLMPATTDKKILKFLTDLSKSYKNLGGDKIRVSDIKNEDFLFYVSDYGSFYKLKIGENNPIKFSNILDIVDTIETFGDRLVSASNKIFSEEFFEYLYFNQTLLYERIAKHDPYETYNKHNEEFNLWEKEYLYTDIGRGGYIISGFENERELAKVFGYLGVDYNKLKEKVKKIIPFSDVKIYYNSNTDKIIFYYYDNLFYANHTKTEAEYFLDSLTKEDIYPFVEYNRELIENKNYFDTIKCDYLHTLFLKLYYTPVYSDDKNCFYVYEQNNDVYFGKLMEQVNKNYGICFVNFDKFEFPDTYNNNIHHATVMTEFKNDVELPDDFRKEILEILTK